MESPHVMDWKCMHHGLCSPREPVVQMSPSVLDLHMGKEKRKRRGDWGRRRKREEGREKKKRKGKGKGKRKRERKGKEKREEGGKEEEEKTYGKGGPQVVLFVAPPEGATTLQSNQNLKSPTAPYRGDLNDFGCSQSLPEGGAKIQKI